MSVGAFGASHVAERGCRGCQHSGSCAAIWGLCTERCSGVCGWVPNFLRIRTLLSGWLILGVAGFQGGGGGLIEAPKTWGGGKGSIDRTINQ